MLVLLFIFRRIHAVEAFELFPEILNVIDTGLIRSFINVRVAAEDQQGGFRSRMDRMKAFTEMPETDLTRLYKLE